MNNVINDESEEVDVGSDTPDEREMDDIITESLQSNNGLVVLFSIGKLLRILKPYTQEEKLGHFDKNLFLSFYSSKASDPIDEEVS